MRIFVNNVDGYLAGAICADLYKLSRNIIGTRKGRSDDLVPPVVKRIVPRIEVRRLLKTVASCDVVIYDLHDADLEELEMVLRTLHISELPQDLTFILISSVGVWARTQREYQQAPVPEPPLEEPKDETAPAEEDGEEEAKPPAEEQPPAPPPMQPVALASEDYIRRVAAPKFQEWRAIETLVLALKEKGTVRPYVCCCGVPYGNGEEPFLALFKAAWQTQPSLRVIGDGRNYVPMVHCRDAARLVRHVVEVKPALDYHLAVDRGDITQRGLIEAVATEFGVPYEVKSVSVAEAVLAEMADILTMDLRLEPSPLMEGPPDDFGVLPATPAAARPSSTVGGSAGRPSSTGPGGTVKSDADDDVEDENAGPGPFRWWCEQGLAANVSKVAEEFCRWRRLTPVRFCIVGPPGGSERDLCKLVAEQYNLPPINFADLVEEHRNLETPLGQQLREQLDQIAAAAANPKAQGPFWLPATLTKELVEAAVDTKPARYRGYVLAGFPGSSEEMAALFLEDGPPPADPKGPQEKVAKPAMAPDVLVVLSSTEEACLARDQAGERPTPETEFKKRMDRWKTEQPAIEDAFLQKFGLEGVQVDADEAAEKTFEEAAAKVAAIVEAKRPVYNFMPPRRRGSDKQAEEAPLEEAPVKDEDAARREEEAQRRKKEQEERIEQIRKEEYARLEKHSEPLRQYLMTRVVPVLTTGLIEVCRDMPEDPVGYLSEYLAIYSKVARARGRRPSKQAMAPGEA